MNIRKDQIWQDGRNPARQVRVTAVDGRYVHVESVATGRKSRLAPENFNPKLRSQAFTLILEPAESVPVDVAATPPSITDKQRSMMIHSLGFGMYGRVMRPRYAYRNYYCASADSPECTAWEDLERRGLAARNTQKRLDFPHVTFHITRQGIEALGDEIRRRIPKGFELRDGQAFK